MRPGSLAAFALVTALAACAAEDPGIPPFSLISQDGSTGGSSSLSAASSNGTMTMTNGNAANSAVTVGSTTVSSATSNSITSGSATGNAMAATGSNPLGNTTTSTSSTVSSATATMTTGGATNGGPPTAGSTTAGSTTAGSTTGNAATSSTTGGAPCTNVRPTGTEWDEATCDQWASETSECNMAWMVDNNYCNESCGRCMTGAFGGA